MDVENIYRRSGSSWIMVYQSYQALSVTADPVIVFQPAGFIGAVGGSSTANTTGGKGTITYSWTYVEGTVLNVSGANSKSAYFSYNFPPQGGTVWSTYRVTVSDGISSASANVSINLTLGSPI